MLEGPWASQACERARAGTHGGGGFAVRALPAGLVQPGDLGFECAAMLKATGSHA